MMGLMNENNDQEISGLDDFFDDDPTDKLPVLNLRDIDPQLADQFDSPLDEDTDELPLVHEAYEIPVLEPDASLTQDQANLPLRQMELEIEALQTNWHKIEDDVRSRDEAIEILEAELLAQKAATDQLREELDESKAELAKANEAFARLTEETAERLSGTERQQAHLQSVEAELLEQQAATDRLREQLDESSATTGQGQ
jgi:hypothetical protein